MANYEESAKAYENDYKFAPVGMAVGSFWGGALAAGLVAFVMSCGIAKGAWGSTIHDGQRTLFANDASGLFMGIKFAVVLLAVSIALGLIAYSATGMKRDLGALWKLSLIGVPLLSAIGVFFAIVTTH